MTLEIRQDDPASPALAELLAFHRADSRSQTPPENAHSLDAAGLTASAITFWSAWDGPALAGFGALKDLGERAGEVKSMRTAPDHLRKGVARAILDRIVVTARARGYVRVSLETGTAPLFDPANRLYEAFGFIDCPAFGGYPPSIHNRFMTLTLGD